MKGLDILLSTDATDTVNISLLMSVHKYGPQPFLRRKEMI
jgi:hypothetical protein